MPAPKPVTTINSKFTTAPAFAEMSKSMNDWTAAWMEGATRWYGDSAKFVSDRLERDRQALERFAGCKTFAEFAEVQQDWIGKAADDYTRESRRVMELALSSATFTPSSAQPQETPPANA